MGLDLKYIPAGDLQEYFVDKDTGLPLAGGIVTFYEDNSRTTLKPMYQISGIPPNYTYTVLPNPMILSSVGTFQDGSGNDIIPYFYPYDLLGNIDLYYVTVESAGSVLQFTREGQPNIAEGAAELVDMKNYTANGQFYLHNDIVATDVNDAGEITNPITVIAPGIWKFDRSATSTAQDYVLFENFGSWIANPPGNPQYSVRIKCNTPNLTDIYKRLDYIFNYDVNKFSSDTQYYTFSFAAQNNITATQVQISIYKDYGVGGSTATDDLKKIFTILPGYNIYTTSFTFGSNSGKTIGANSSVSIHVNFPTDNVFDINFTNFILTDGQVNITDFPVTTNNEFDYQSMFGETQFSTDGSDLYLPLVKTRNGVEVDDSSVGSIMTQIYNGTFPSYHLCDGTKFTTIKYSPEGIPHSRLLNKIWNTNGRVPRYGTGNAFVTSFTGYTPTHELVLTTNAKGSVTNTANGAVSTGFTFGVVHTGYAGGYEITAYTRGLGNFYIVSNNTDTDISNAPFVTYPDAYYVTIPVPTGFSKTVIDDGAYNTPIIERNSVTAGNAVLAGEYGIFQITPHQIPYDAVSGNSYVGYWWYTVDGVGADPDPAIPLLGRHYKYKVQVNIKSTDSIEVVEEKTRCALNGWHVSSIATIAASGMTAGCYFTFSTLTTDYYAWYTINGVGTDPALASRTGIQVDLLSTDTNTQVATKTQIAINSVYYALPDFRGYILRSSDSTGIVDTDSSIRWSLVPGQYGSSPGGFQFNNNKSHSHNLWQDSGGAGLPYTFTSTDSVGAKYRMAGMTFMSKDDQQNESRPKNTAVYYYIKY